MPPFPGTRQRGIGLPEEEALHEIDIGIHQHLQRVGGLDALGQH
ncbi:MAG: hypothetical protein VB137_00120 [Burkholderia sp.]